ncbi:amino acid aminotransferase [Bradyrhizobium mercantei]|uniref:amino acid aminotransferase n=1 Tax=Bradyrhizobium mercantei TaxID=1904807 RepID=UPI00097691A6|nr:amino acid aminotransferase [Bradyrhizobium mercantei]
MFSSLSVLPTDSVLGLIRLHAEDPNPSKIDLGVGVYRDAAGKSPIMAAVKEAEKRLVSHQRSKTYFGSEGDPEFLASIIPLVFGEARLPAERVVACQAVGGTGALRLAATLAAFASSEPRIWIGVPTWPNHLPVLQSAGLKIQQYSYFDPSTQSVQFELMKEALKQAKPGDLVLLHACCHNPTGADLTPEQWQEVADLLVARKLLPLIDFAYAGFATSLAEDRRGIQTILAQVPEALIAFSCSKTFGLYRERTGALFVLADSSKARAPILSSLQVLARTVYSTPPDHGAAVVRTILNDPELTAGWQGELRQARDRIANLRRELGRYGQVNRINFAALSKQNGMFSLLPLTKDEVVRLRTGYSIYMAESGRINLAGLRTSDMEYFIHSISEVTA